MQDTVPLKLKWKKKFTSLTVISDTDAHPIVTPTNKAKEKIIQNNFNGSDHKICTLEHDIKCVDIALADLPKHDKSIILSADTDYLSETKKKELESKKVSLVTPLI